MLQNWCTTDSIDDEVKRWAVDVSSLFHKDVNYPIEMQTLELIFYYCFGQNMNGLNDVQSLLLQLEKHNLPYLVQQQNQQAIDLQLKILFNYVKKAGRPMYALYNLNQKLQNQLELDNANKQLKEIVSCQQPSQVNQSQLSSQVLCDLQQLSFNSKWSESQLSKLQQSVECLIDQQLLITKLNIDQKTLSFQDLIQTYVKQYENYTNSIKQLINVTADEQAKDLITQNLNDSLKYLCQTYQQLQDVQDLEDGTDYRLRIFTQFTNNMNKQIIFNTIQLFKKAIAQAEQQGIRVIIDETITWPQEEPNVNLDQLEQIIQKTSQEQVQPLIKDCLYTLLQLEIEQYYNLFSSSLSLTNKREAFSAFQNHIQVLDNIMEIINLEQDSELLAHYNECKKFASLIDNIDSKTPSTTISQFRYQLKASACYDMLVTFFGQYKSNLIKDSCINLAQMEEKLQQAVDQCDTAIQLPSTTQISGQMLDIKQNILRQVPTENDMNELLLLNNQMIQQGEKQVQDNLYIKNIELLYNLALQQNQSEQQENIVLEKAILNGKNINKQITDNIKQIVQLLELYKNKFSEAKTLQNQAAETHSLQLSEQSLTILDQLLFDVNYNNHGDFILPKFEQIYTYLYSQVFTSSILTEDYVVCVVKTLNLLIQNVDKFTIQVINNRNQLLKEQKLYFSHQILVPQFQHTIENIVNFINNFQQIASLLIHFDFQKNQTQFELIKQLENQILNIIQNSVDESEFQLIKGGLPSEEDGVFIQDFAIQVILRYFQLIKSQKQILPTYLNLIMQMGDVFNKSNKDEENEQIQNMNDLLEKYEQSSTKYEELIEILMGMGKSYEFGFDLTTTCRDKLIKNAQNVEVTMDSFQIIQLTKKPNLTLNYQLFNELKDLLNELDLQIKRQECGKDNKIQIQMFVRQSVKDLYDVLVKLNPKDIKGLEGQQIQENIISRSQISTTRLSEQDSMQIKFDANKYINSQINMIANHDVSSNVDYVENCPLQSIQIFDQICDQIRTDITIQLANKQLQDNTLNCIIDLIDSLSNIINEDIKQMMQYYQMVVNNQQFNEVDYNTFYLLQQESNSYIIVAKFINQLAEMLQNVKFNIPQEKLPTLNIQDIQQIIQCISQFQSVSDKINSQNIQKLTEKVQQRKENQLYKYNNDQVKKLVSELSQKQDFLSSCSRKLLTLLNKFLNQGGYADQETVELGQKAQEKLIRDSGNNDIVVQVKGANKYIVNLSQGKKLQQPFYNKAIQTQGLNCYEQTLILPQSAICMEMLQKCYQQGQEDQLQYYSQFISQIVNYREQIMQTQVQDEKLVLVQKIHNVVGNLIKLMIQNNLLNQKQISDGFNAAIRQLMENEQTSNEIKELLNNDSQILNELDLQSAKFVNNDKFKADNEVIQTQLQKILIIKSQYDNENVIFGPIFAQLNQVFNKYQLQIDQQQADISKTIKDMIYQGSLDLNKEQLTKYVQTTLMAQQDLDQICSLIQTQFKQNQISKKLEQEVYQQIKKLVQFYNNINSFNLSFNRAYDTIIDYYILKSNILSQLQITNQILEDSQQQMINGKISNLYNKYYDELLAQAEQLIKDHQQMVDKLQQYKNISYQAYNFLSNQKDKYVEEEDKQIAEQIENLKKNKESFQLIRNQLISNINIKFQSLVIQITSILLQQTDNTLTKVFINRETTITQFQLQQGQMKHNIIDELINYGDKVRQCQLLASKTLQQKPKQNLSKDQLKIQISTQQQQQQEVEQLLQEVKPSISDLVQKQLNVIDYKLSNIIKRWLYSDFENSLNKNIIIIGQQLNNLYLNYDKCNQLQYQSIQQQQTVIYIKHIQDYIQKIQILLQQHLNKIYDVLEKKEQYDKQEFDEEILFLIQGRQILEQLAMMTPYYEDYEEQLKDMQQILFKCVNIHFKNCFDQDFQDNKKQLYDMFCNQVLRELLDIGNQFQQAVEIDGCDYSEKQLIEIAKIIQKTVQLTIQSMQQEYKVTIEDEILSTLHEQSVYNNIKLLPYYNTLSELESIWNYDIQNSSKLPLMTTRIVLNKLANNIKESIKSTLPSLQCCQALGLWKGLILQNDLSQAIILQLQQSKDELQEELQQLIDTHQSFADEEQVQYSSTFIQTPLIYQAQIRSLLIAIEAVEQATPVECLENTNLSSIKFYEKLNKCQFEDCYSITLQLGNNLSQVQQLFEYDKEDKQLVIRKPKSWSFFAPSLSLQNSYINKITNNGQIFSVLNKCYLLTVNKQFDTQQPIKQAKISFTSTYTLEQTVYEKLEQYIKSLLNDCKQVLDCYTQSAQSHQLLQAITFKPIFDKLLSRAYIAQQFMLQLCHEIGVEFTSLIQSPNDVFKNLFVGQKGLQLLESTFDQLNYQDKKALQQTVIQLKDNFSDVIGKIILYNNQTAEQIRQLLTKAYLQTQQTSKQEANKLFAIMSTCPLFNLQGQNLLSQLVFDDDQFENNFIDDEFAEQCYQFVQQYESLQQVLDDNTIDNQVQKKVIQFVYQIITNILDDNKQDVIQEEQFETQIMHKSVSNIQQLISQPWKIQKYIFLSTIGQQVDNFYKGGLTLRKLSEQYQEIITGSQQQQLNNIKLLVNQQDMLTKTQQFMIKDNQKQIIFDYDTFKQQLSEVKSFYIQEMETQDNQYNKYCQEGKKQFIDLMNVIITNCQAKFANTQLQIIDQEQILNFQAQGDYYYQQLHATLQLLQVYDFKLQEQCGNQDVFAQTKQLSQQVRKVLLELKSQIKNVILQFQDVDKEVAQIEQVYNCPYELYRRAYNVLNITRQSEVEELLEIAGEVRDVSYDSKKIYEIADIDDKIMKFCSVVKKEINSDQLQEDVDDLLEVVRGKI